MMLAAAREAGKDDIDQAELQAQQIRTLADIHAHVIREAARACGVRMNKTFGMAREDCGKVIGISATEFISSIIAATPDILRFGDIRAARSPQPFVCRFGSPPPVAPTDPGEWAVRILVDKVVKDDTARILAEAYKYRFETLQAARLSAIAAIDGSP